ncbi:helix-turn-helix domain-containing protein [Paraburkholderia phenazinium]|jgi:transcriptional regulator with XRE-family HTH domain|uniref:helix-turn-helix domain-containing protein n=1 Tax=Paraburkholderia phenazinium TaxID=60549 RepID=UPI00158C8511|nr:helix-turn-helix transcriptional regulator [Paraburkholderia phenazinium]
MAFGRVLRRYRRAAGLTQEQLALEADVQRTYVSLMELGRNQPTITTIFKLARALHCTPSAMVSATEEECGRP